MILIIKYKDLFVGVGIETFNIHHSFIRIGNAKCLTMTTLINEPAITIIRITMAKRIFLPK